jgi:hypothetical protein
MDYETKFCLYCKELIEDENNVVIRNGKTYHLGCYHLILGTPSEESHEYFDE